jgi:MFS transporter, YNFM family, putative membrane transport protein
VEEVVKVIPLAGEQAEIVGKETSAGTAGIIAVSLAGVGANLNLYAPQPLLPMLSTHFAASKAAVGMTVSATTLGVALTAPLWGMLAERIGRRRVIVAAMFLLTLPTLLASTAGSLPVLVFWRFLQGVVMPGIFGVTIAYVSEEWPSGRVAAVMAFYVSGSVLGGFFGRMITGYAASHALFPGLVAGWHGGFLVLGFCDLSVAVLLAYLLPKDRRRLSTVRGGESPAGVLRVLRNPQMMATCAVGFTVLFSLVATFTYVTFHLAAPPYSLSASRLSELFVVYLVGAATTPIAGRWIVRVGSRRALLTAVLVAMSGVLLTLAGSLPLILLGLVICSAAVFVCQSASTSYIHKAAPAGGRSSAAGLYVSCYYIGGSVAGVLPGLIWGYGGWTACVLLVLGVQALTMLIAGLAWEDNGRRAGNRI